MEIRIRGKSKVTGRWVYGDLIHYENGDVAILEKPFSAYGYEATQMDRRTQVSPETVGLSTGLKDKHGKEIWEGDKVKWIDDAGDDGRMEVSGEVYWRLPMGGFCVRDVYGAGMDCWIGDTDPDTIEVIGNIYENSELVHSTCSEPPESK